MKRKPIDPGGTDSNSNNGDSGVLWTNRNRKDRGKQEWVLPLSSSNRLCRNVGPALLDLLTFQNKLEECVCSSTM